MAIASYGRLQSTSQALYIMVFDTGQHKKTTL